MSYGKLIILINLLSLFLLANTALAQTPNINPLNYNTFGEILDGIFRVIFWIVIVLAPALIIAGGALMLFAGANLNNIALGKKIILYTIVIFVIILILRAMISYFKGDLTFH